MESMKGMVYTAERNAAMVTALTKKTMMLSVAANVSISTQQAILAPRYSALIPEGGAKRPKTCRLVSDM